MNKQAVTTLLKDLLHRAGIRVHRALFRHMVKSGLVLCAVDLADDHDTATDDTQDTDNQDDQNGEEDTGTATGDDEDADKGATDEESDDEVIVSIGEESPPSDEEDISKAPDWVRELRTKHRETSKRVRELEEENARLKGTGKPAAVTVGEKPTLEGCDYDAERFERELESYQARKRAADEQDRKKRDAEQAEKDAWQAKLDAYGKSKGELKVKDYDDVETIVTDTLNGTQQGIILNGAENPALLVYALGKNPKKAKELASITDPVKFAFAVAKLETQLKVTPRKAPPPPENIVKGSAPVSGSVDSQLERLRADAAKTGDFTKVHQYKKQQREKRS